MPVFVLIAADFALAPALEAGWLARLPPRRQDELRGWPDAPARQRSLLGSRLLEIGLGRLGHPAAALMTLAHPPRSRPTLGVAVHFSLSHCDGRVLCAVSTDGPVGIDVEALGGLTAAAFALYLNPVERAWAGRSPRRFYSVWTRKEAVAKAAGTTGLPALPAVDTSIGAARAAFGGRVWLTQAIPVGRGHVAHLALAEAAPGAGHGAFPAVALLRPSREALEGSAARPAPAPAGPARRLVSSPPTHSGDPVSPTPNPRPVPRTVPRHAPPASAARPERAVILSAGQGSRLLPLTEGLPKCLIDLCGRSMLEWQLRALAEVGVRAAVVVTGFRSELVDAALQRMAPPALDVRTLYNPFYKLADNLASCWMARAELAGPCLVLNGDTLFEPEIARRLLAAPPAPITVTIDRKPGYDDDDMKVEADGDRLRAIGKTLTPQQSNGESIGFLRFDAAGAARFVAQIERMIRTPAGPGLWYLSAINELAKVESGADVRVASIEGLDWGELDFPADLAPARALAAAWLAREAPVAANVGR